MRVAVVEAATDPVFLYGIVIEELSGLAVDLEIEKLIVPKFRNLVAGARKASEKNDLVIVIGAYEREDQLKDVLHGITLVEAQTGRIVLDALFDLSEYHDPDTFLIEARELIRKTAKVAFLALYQPEKLEREKREMWGRSELERFLSL